MARQRPKHYRLSQDGPVAILTFLRPDRKTPLFYDALAEMADCFSGLMASQTVHAVVMAGAGGNFGSSLEAGEMLGLLLHLKPAARVAAIRQAGALIGAIRRAPQPVIAALDGPCSGACAALASACDLRLATVTAKVSFGALKLGLPRAELGASVLLPRLIGQGRANELMLTGRAMNAEEGERWGFFNRLLAADALLPAAIELAHELAEKPALARASTKQLLTDAGDQHLAAAIDAEIEALARCVANEDPIAPAINA
jgi:enoyl-CoA hydratase/carnithine racemase